MTLACWSLGWDYCKFWGSLGLHDKTLTQRVKKYLERKGSWNSLQSGPQGDSGRQGFVFLMEQDRIGGVDLKTWSLLEGGVTRDQPFSGWLELFMCSSTEGSVLLQHMAGLTFMLLFFPPSALWVWLAGPLELR